jgi:hypothetical protein
MRPTVEAKETYLGHTRSAVTTSERVGGGSRIKRLRNVCVAKVLICAGGIDLVLHRKEPGGRFCILTETLLAGGADRVLSHRVLSHCHGNCQHDAGPADPRERIY